MEILTYEFSFSSTSFAYNLLSEQESNKVSAILLYNRLENFYFGINFVENDCLTGIVQIDAKDFRELWRYILILVREYL
jgi:hypothetical protein